MLFFTAAGLELRELRDVVENTTIVCPQDTIEEEECEKKEGVERKNGIGDQKRIRE